MPGPRQITATLVLLGILVWPAAFPGSASAHGPIAPVATSYLARVHRAPTGLDARVVDGDLRMWLSVPTRLTVVVLDYRGAPYLRFSRSGVQVNENASMYYLNQTPVPQRPPLHLNADTPPRWRSVSGGHDYGWHDGRLHALATIAIASGTRYVGAWRIPIRVDGRPSSISGGVWHAARPSILWFWPALVMLSCALAAWRIRRPALDARLARGLAVAALVGVAAAGTVHQLHGRPFVSDFQLAQLAVILGFVALGLCQTLLRRPGYLSYFLISVAALWEGVVLAPTLTDGFVLTAGPAAVSRVAAVLCLGAGTSLLPFVVRLVHGSPEAARRSVVAASGPR